MKISERSANLTMDSLNLINNYEVRKIIMIVVGNIETTSIFLDYGATLHMFTDQA